MRISNISWLAKQWQNPMRRGKYISFESVKTVSNTAKIGQAPTDSKKEIEKKVNRIRLLLLLSHNTSKGMCNAEEKKNSDGDERERARKKRTVSTFP